MYYSVLGTNECGFHFPDVRQFGCCYCYRAAADYVVDDERIEACIIVSFKCFPFIISMSSVLGNTFRRTERESERIECR